MKRIVISGGAGFIGSRVAKKLVEIGYEVILLDLLSKQIHGDDPEGSDLYRSIRDLCEVVKGDVRSRNDWIHVLDGADAVIHLAAETGTGQSMYEIAHYTDVNIEGTSLLLDIIQNTANGIGRLVVASSRAIYGEGKYKCVDHGIQYPESRKIDDIQKGQYDPVCAFCGKPMIAMATDESSLIAPTSVYGITKQVQEQLVLLFGRMTGISTIALRYQNVYGPGQSLKNPYTGILSIFSTSMLLGNPIEIFEDGLESRDFVYIDDVVNATILSLECEKGVHTALNIGSGIPVSVRHVADSLKLLYGSSSEITTNGKFRIGDIRHNYADLSKAKTFINYEPRVTFEVGLERFTTWVRTQPVGDDGYRKSLAELEKKGLYK